MFNFSFVHPLTFWKCKLQVQKGFALSASDKLIACACSDGIVQLSTTETLNYVGSLQYTKSKSYQGKPSGVHCHTNTAKAVSSLPDAVACQFSNSEKLGKQPYINWVQQLSHLSFTNMLSILYVSVCSGCLWRSYSLHLGYSWSETGDFSA